MLGLFTQPKHDSTIFEWNLELLKFLSSLATKARKMKGDHFLLSPTDYGL